MINYITKPKMLKKFKGNYFGITEFFVDDSLEPVIYIRKDLPKCVQVSVLAHEEEHAQGGKGSPEWKSWVAGFKATPKGWALSVLMSLTPSRLKMYPALSAAVALFIGVFLLVYFKV